MAYSSKSLPNPPVFASPIIQGKMMCSYSGAPETVHTTLDRPRDMNSLTWASKTTAGNFNTKSKSNRGKSSNDSHITTRYMNQSGHWESLKFSQWKSDEQYRPIQLDQIPPINKSGIYRRIQFRYLQFWWRSQAHAIGWGIPRKLEVASPVSTRRELDEPIGETSSSCSPQSSHTSTFSAASGWKVSPIGYWGTVRYPISKCYHVEIIASTSTWYTGQ